MHVNADYPEHVDFVFKLAMEYRMKFKRDVVIDVSGYRKFGHNEQDQPFFTQPQTYEQIQNKTPMWKLYCDQLIQEGAFTQAEIDKKFDVCRESLEKALAVAKNQTFSSQDWDPSTFKTLISINSNPKNSDRINPTTSITEKEFKTIGKLINQLPEGKNFHTIINSVYKQRLQAIESGEGVDWAGAEALAFGTLLEDGFGVRLSGEDVRRGTFSHRHAAIMDQKDYTTYIPLGSLLEENEKIRLQIYNSFLSEYGVLGFDYGYSIGNPNFLTIWEGQFGDFSNVAQPIIDQYIAGGERKWGVKSGLTLLLPHGYDGQGPEHSSARLERFLTFMDDDYHDAKYMSYDAANQARIANLFICNITEPANYFHVLRRQLYKSEFRKPLIIMSPKKLLRLKEAKSNMKDFTAIERFREVIPEAEENTLISPTEITQVIFCSGQIYYDLAERRRKLQRKVTLGDSRTSRSSE